MAATTCLMDGLSTGFKSDQNSDPYLGLADYLLMYRAFRQFPPIAASFSFSDVSSNTDRSAYRRP
jgi:hypothetical protein